MKNLYVCEMCGKQFTEWDDAWACERSHASAYELYGWELENGSNFALQRHAAGEVAPTVVYLKVPVLGKDGEWLKDEHGVQLYDIYPFKRQAHDRVCGEMEESMRKRSAADRAELEATEDEG